MLDTIYHHSGAHPSQMLKLKQKIIVTKKKPNERKPYIKKYIKPGDLFTNKWYFQHDIVNTPLAMITTTACELDYYFVSPHGVSHSISFYSLNTKIFKKNMYKHVPTSGYEPTVNFHLYATKNGTDNPKVGELIYLGDTEQYYKGNTVNESGKDATQYIQHKEHWGNPFHPIYINHEVTMFMSTQQPTTVITGDTTSQAKNITKFTQPIVVQCRYTPNQDTGEGNKVYMCPTTREINYMEPTDKQLIFEGYPLYILLWGWYDWIEKLNIIHQTQRDYQIVIKSKFIQPSLDFYVVLDDTFCNGKSPYQTTEAPPHDIEDQHYWYPQCKYQQIGIEEICVSGPGTAKPLTKNIEAHMQYTAFFKWGGCPANMETAINPSTQPTYPLPDNIYKAYEIKDPTTAPEYYLYEWDEKSGLLTTPASKRITEYKKTKTSLFSDGTTNKFNPPIKQTTTTGEEILQTLIQTPSTKEKIKTLQHQLNIQQQQQQLYKLRIQQLAKINLR